MTAVLLEATGVRIVPNSNTKDFLLYEANMPVIGWFVKHLQNQTYQVTRIRHVTHAFQPVFQLTCLLTTILQHREIDQVPHTIESDHTH